jgi:hypothetical protein
MSKPNRTITKVGDVVQVCERTTDADGVQHCHRTVITDLSEFNVNDTELREAFLGTPSEP